MALKKENNPTHLPPDEEEGTASERDKFSLIFSFNWHFTSEIWENSHGESQISRNISS